MRMYEEKRGRVLFSCVRTSLRQGQPWIGKVRGCGLVRLYLQERVRIVGGGHHLDTFTGDDAQRSSSSLQDRCRSLIAVESKELLELTYSRNATFLTRACGGVVIALPGKSSGEQIRQRGLQA